MFIHRFYLSGFKPLLHGDIKTIEATDLTQITMIAGENGKGKSSILRELTPLPASRSDYQKDGKKILEFSHDKSNYILTSDFSKTTGVHSFVKDGVELNLSGTTEIQQGLTLQCFGYDELLDRIMSCQCRISSMGKPDRKNLFMSTYPSSLLFILEHHKKISAQIRACTSQLKMLNTRKLELQQNLIDRKLFDEYQEYKQDLDKASITLDQDIYMLQQTINKYNTKDINDVDYGSITTELEFRCSALLYEFRTKVTNGELNQKIDIKNLDYLLADLSAKQSSILVDLDQLNKQGVRTKDTIEKYQKYLNYDNEKAIDECKNLITFQEEVIKTYDDIDESVPMVDDNTLKLLSDRKDAVGQAVEYLMTNTIYHWEPEIYDNVERRIANWEQQVRYINQNYIARLEETKKTLIYKLSRFADKSYPVDCMRICKLRDSVKDIVDSTNIELTEVVSKLEQYKKESDYLNNKIKLLKNAIQDRGTERPIITRLINFLSNDSWGYFVTNNQSPIFIINHNLTLLWNNYQKIIKQNEHRKILKEAKDKLIILNNKLASLQATELPVKHIVTQTILEHENLLTDINIKIDNLLYKKELVIDKLERNTHLKNIWTEINDIFARWRELAKKIVLKEEIRFIKEMIYDLSNTKTQISEKLREIETIISSQKDYLVRLRYEIEPNIEKIQNKMEKLIIIEKQLSPTNGIPFIYIVRYINSVFILANKFISRVWNYDMSLKYLKEDEDLDYTFRVVLNRNSEVKDVNMCSMGQKSIIDLAVTLAISVYRGYVTRYPLKLDEVDVALTPIHRDNLTEFLSELLHQQSIMQTFVVNHYVALSSSFSDAGMIALSQDGNLPENCILKAKINK